MAKAKNKSFKTLKKRFKVNKNKVIKRKKAFASHLLSKYRNTVRKRKKELAVEIFGESALTKLIKKLKI